MKEYNSKELLHPHWFDEYNKEIGAIWEQLIQFKTNNIVLQKIYEFPFKVFSTEHHSPFWRLVIGSITETNVMICWRMVEERGNTLSFVSACNNIGTNLRSQKYIQEYDDMIRELNFDDKISDIRKRVKRIRDARFAHFNRKWILSRSIEEKQKDLISLDEFHQIGNIFEELFNAICFGQRRGLVLMRYDVNDFTKESYWKKSDLDEILDNVARNSALLNMPEEQPEYWPVYRDTLSEYDLSVMNKFRKKFGKSEV